MQTLRHWLTHLGLAQYAEAFESNAITLALATELTEQDLKDLGIWATG